MINIDYIMSLIDWNKSINEQEDGIKMAEDVENINVFLQPCNKNYNKNVWDNCAKILTGVVIIGNVNGISKKSVREIIRKLSD